MNEAVPPAAPVPFAAIAAALEAINESVQEARHPSAGTPATTPPPLDGPGPHPALAALLLLREVREQLAGWESGLIETARGHGASWADLAGPLGVASRQAAERRYLRLRPGAAGSTGEERVQATRDTRAADRSVTTWARDHGAELRRLAGQVTSLTDLPTTADNAVADLNQALAHHDPARLLRPLTATRSHLGPRNADLTDRIDALTQHTEQLRRNTHDQRNA